MPELRTLPLLIHEPFHIDGEERPIQLPPAGPAPHASFALIMNPAYTMGTQDAMFLGGNGRDIEYWAILARNSAGGLFWVDKDTHRAVVLVLNMVRNGGSDKWEVSQVTDLATITVWEPVLAAISTIERFQAIYTELSRNALLWG